MKLYLFAKMKFLMVPLLALSSMSIPSLTQAEEDGWFPNADWYTITFDNDTFVGNDNGYSNGMNFSWWDTAIDGSVEQGLVYTDAHHRHANTETIVGHATLATGANPSIHGMVANVYLYPVGSSDTF